MCSAVQINFNALFMFSGEGRSRANSLAAVHLCCRMKENSDQLQGVAAHSTGFFEMLAEVPLLEGSGEETGKSGKRQRMD